MRLKKDESPRDILELAAKLVSGDRQEAYGHPSEDFKKIAAMWEQILSSKECRVKISPRKVALCMIAVKISRETYKSKKDNWVDIAGYAGCGSVCE